MVTVKAFVVLVTTSWPFNSGVSASCMFGTEIIRMSAFLERTFLYLELCSILCLRAVKAPKRPSMCTYSPEPSMLASAMARFYIMY